MCVWGGGVAWIIFLTSLKCKAVETTKDDAFARKECPAAFRTFLVVSDGVNKPLSVVESYWFFSNEYFTLIHTSFLYYILFFIVKFCNCCTQLKCGTSEEE